jgi:hypothetical protein
MPEQIARACNREPPLQPMNGWPSVAIMTVAQIAADKRELRHVMLPGIKQRMLTPR